MARVLAAAVLLVLFDFGASFGENATLLIPNSNHLLFHEDNVGAMITYNMQTYIPLDERQCCIKVNPSTFDPSNLDTDQWITAAKSFGAKYAVLTADHFSGFSIFPTAQHNYSVMHSVWRNGTGDVVRDYVQSCLKIGVRPGWYYSVHENWFYNISNFAVPAGPNQAQRQDAYDNMALAQLQEIQQHFGSNLAQLWFDAGISTPSTTFIESLNEWAGGLMATTNATCHSCQALNRTHEVFWMGNEMADMPYPVWYSNTESCSSPNGVDPSTVAAGTAQRWCSPHCDAVIREHIWFWQTNPPPTKSVETLVKQYLSSVGRGCNLILNLNPDTTGSVPADDASAYAGMGHAIEVLFNTSVVAATPSQVAKGTRVTWGPHSNTTVTLTYGAVELEEDIQFGQTIRSYSVELSGPDGWVPLVLMDMNGKTNMSLTIGRRRIQLFKLPEPVKASAFRFVVNDWLNATYIQEEGAGIIYRPEGTQPALRSAKVFDWAALSATQVGFDPRDLFKF